MTKSLDQEITLTLTAESIPFRDGEIRLALVPFPLKRKDGSYKIGTNATPYIVFPDNRAYLFNDIFDCTMALPWPGGSPITLTEREDIDDAAWDIFRKYGLIVGEFLSDPWGESDTTSQIAPDSDPEGNAWHAVDELLSDAISPSESESEPDYDWLSEQHAQFSELAPDVSDTNGSSLPLPAGSVTSSPAKKRKSHSARQQSTMPLQGKEPPADLTPNNLPASCVDDFFDALWETVQAHWHRVDHFEPGDWEACALSNGGFYLSPPGPPQIVTFADADRKPLSAYFTGSFHINQMPVEAMSHDAFGVTCCLLVLHSMKHHALFNALNAFAVQHPERSAIQRAMRASLSTP